MYLIDKKRLIFLWSPLTTGKFVRGPLEIRIGGRFVPGPAFMRAVSIATSSRLEALYL
jgi:hypothetical protein